MRGAPERQAVGARGPFGLGAPGPKVGNAEGNTVSITTPLSMNYPMHLVRTGIFPIEIDLLPVTFVFLVRGYCAMLKLCRGHDGKK